MTSPATLRKPRAPAQAAKPARVRRDSAQDQAKLCQDVLDAAMGLFQAQGLEGVTMRGVASRVGVSAMALYRYFPSKSALLRGLWESSLVEVHEQQTAAMASAGPSARDKVRAFIDSFLAYYEGRPDHYRLIFMTEQTYEASVEARWADAPIYRTVLEAAQQISRDLALETGGDPARARLASDLRFSMMVGYLHASLINRRYPWLDLTTLRIQTVEQVAQAVERCLQAPAGDAAWQI
jgi:AcrR family transcriptional regulator